MRHIQQLKDNAWERLVMVSILVPTLTKCTEREIKSPSNLEDASSCLTTANYHVIASTLYSTTAIDCQDHISSACCLSFLRVVKEVFLCRWCADFEEKGRHRVLRIMLALTLVILPVTVFSIGAVKFGSSQQKSLPHIPRAGNHTSLHAIYVFISYGRFKNFKLLDKT